MSQSPSRHAFPSSPSSSSRRHDRNYRSSGSSTLTPPSSYSRADAPRLLHPIPSVSSQENAPSFTGPSGQAENVVTTPQHNRSGSGKGKRKASELADSTPPKDVSPEAGVVGSPSGSVQKGSVKGRARFLETANGSSEKSERVKRVSGSSTTTSSPPPSSFHGGTGSSRHAPKRARLSHSRSSLDENGGDDTVDEIVHIPRSSSRTSKRSSQAPHSPISPNRPQHTQHRPRSPSLSAASIPISALISPHAPSISHHTHANIYHMRDPRKVRVQPTGWTLHLPSTSSGGWKAWPEDGSPLHGYIFFIGFVLPLLWPVGGWVVKVPKTRRLDPENGNGRGGKSEEVAGGGEGGVVVLDDPQVEHDAKTWRRRNQIASIIALFTYLPFIVCVAYFGSRSKR